MQASIRTNSLLASYKVAHRIMKCKEPCTIAEELNRPAAAVDMVNLMIGEAAGFSALALMKSKYRSKINGEKEISSLISLYAEADLAVGQRGQLTPLARFGK